MVIGFVGFHAGEPFVDALCPVEVHQNQEGDNGAIGVAAALVFEQQPQEFIHGNLETTCHPVSVDMNVSEPNAFTILVRSGPLLIF